DQLTDKNDTAIVRSVIVLGHNPGLRVVAEGVETKVIFDALKDLGCDEAQGYFITRPQDFESLKEWFSTSSWKVEPDGGR
ncbi:MAG: EAL domain-containing protein, partial [Methylococcales bacterium]